MIEITHEPNQEIPINYVLNPEEISDSLFNVAYWNKPYFQRHIPNSVNIRRVLKKLKKPKLKRQLQLFHKYNGLTK